MNKHNLLKGVIAGISTLIGDKLGLIGPALILLCILMIVDYISGMLAAKKEAVEHPEDRRYGWNSKKGVIGIYKKVGYLLTILVAVSTDYIIFRFIKEIGIDYNTNTFFGLLVVIWFVLNELISILENAGRMGVMLPIFMIKILTDIKGKIEEEK